MPFVHPGGESWYGLGLCETRIENPQPPHKGLLLCGYQLRNHRNYAFTETKPQVHDLRARTVM
jgi:hypothetical protein